MAHPTYDVMLGFLKNHSRKKKLAILDYGCGNGYLLSLLPSRWIGSYLGYDVSDAAIAQARSTFHKKYQKFSLLPTKKPLAKKKSIDVMILIGVLQYMKVKEIDRMLTEAKRFLKNDGCILVSCLSDHSIYTYLDLYRFFLPHVSVQRKNIVKQFEKHGFILEQNFERGLFFAPLFAQCLVFPFDALDKILFKTRGVLGPIGNFARNCVNPLLALEYRLPFDYGYTLFLKAKLKNTRS